MAVAPDTSAVVRFADYEVDLREQAVRLKGTQIAIQDKPLQLLLALLERPGQLISREELRKRLWPTDAFGAFEDGVNTAVRKLRIALNDSAETPQFIETVPRRGYRFIAPVSAAVSAEPPQAAQVEAASTGPATPDLQSRQRSQWLKVPAAKVLAALAALVVITASLWFARQWRSPRKAQITSLAVLPLTNLTGDKAQEYFVDGMTNELTTSLAQISGLRVTSETSSRRYRATNKSIPEIARELGVDAVVEGAVARSGDQVRVTAQLISASDDRHLWAESFSRSGSDTLGLQHDVAHAIANRIDLTLTPTSARQLETLPTHNLAAYDAYLRAKYLAKTSLRIELDNRQSIASAEEAVALDPGFAEAYVAVARGYSDRIFSWAGGKEEDAKAFAAIEKAIALNPGLAEAYLVRGMLYYNHLHDFDLVNAIANDKKALSLSPNLAEAHHYLATELTHAGLHDRAIAEYRLALQLDPLNDPAKYRLSRVLWQSGNFTGSIENADHYHINCIEGPLPRLYLGRREQAWALVHELEPQIGGSFRADVDFPAIRAVLYAAEGKTRDAEREIRDAIRLGKTNDHFHHTAFIIAVAYAEMGKPHEAVQWLRRTSEIGMPNYPLFHDNPSMKKLYGNPEYEQFMTEFKPRWQQFATSL